MVSDKFGRKNIFAGSCTCIMFCGIIVAMAPNYIVFALFKFVGGCFQQGIVCGIVTILIELFPTKDRRLSVCLYGVGWGVCCVTLPFIPFLMQDYSWRAVSIALALSSIPCLIQWCYLEESLRWLIANGKSEAAIKLMKRASRCNNKSFTDIIGSYRKKGEQDAIGDDQELQGLVERNRTEEEILHKSTAKLSLIDIMKIRRLFVNAIVMWLAWFTAALSFFVLYLSSTSLAGDPFLNFALTALMEVPPNTSMYWGLNRLGRKPTTIICFAMASVGLIGNGFVRSVTQTTVLRVLSYISSLVAMMGASGAFTAVFFYTSEMFPTNVRNQAVGVSSFMGRVGGMLAPFTGMLAAKAKWGPGILIGCLAFVVALLLKFLPETSGRELPQTIEDLQRWYSKKEVKKDGKEFKFSVSGANGNHKA